MISSNPGASNRGRGNSRESLNTRGTSRARVSNSSKEDSSNRASSSRASRVSNRVSSRDRVSSRARGSSNRDRVRVSSSRDRDRVSSGSSSGSRTVTRDPAPSGMTNRVSTGLTVTGPGTSNSSETRITLMRRQLRHQKKTCLPRKLSVTVSRIS